MAGKTSWTASIYHRSRWATSSLFAAMAAHEELKSGIKAETRGRRHDNCRKDYLVPVRRFEVARSWLQELFEKAPPTTRPMLWQQPENLMIITDACPQGCGGLLLLRPKPTAPWQIHEAYEYELTTQDAAMLGVELSHRGQGYWEALAVWLALRTCRQLLKGIAVALGISWQFWTSQLRALSPSTAWRPSWRCCWKHSGSEI